MPSSYDAAKVLVSTASSNAFFSAGIRVRIHKVSIHNVDGSNTCSALLYDAATATGTATIRLDTSVTGAAGSFERYKEANFDPPLLHEIGLSSTLAGSAALRVFYTRA